MEIEDFNAAALNILAARGETGARDLRYEIELQFNKSKKLCIANFYSRMDNLENDGYVTSRQGIAQTIEKNNARANMPVRYFSITNDGHRKRLIYAERKQGGSLNFPEGLPEPATLSL